MMKFVGLTVFRPSVLCRKLSASAKPLNAVQDKYLHVTMPNFLNWDMLKRSFQGLADVKAIRIAKDGSARRAFVRFDHTVDMDKLLVDYAFLAKRYKIDPIVYQPPKYELPPEHLLQGNHLLVSNLPEQFNWGELKDFLSFAGDRAELRRFKDDIVVASFASVEEASLAKYLIEGSVFEDRPIKLSEYHQPVVASRFRFQHQVYITNLPDNTTETEVKDSLAAQGVTDVRSAKMLDDEGVSLNTCLLEFEEAESVHKAIDLFDNALPIKGSPVFVRTFMSLEDRTVDREKRIVFVSNLPNKYMTDRPLLASLFAAVPDAKILHLSAAHEQFKHGKCFGYVEFDSVEAAQSAIESVNNQRVDGVTIKVQAMHARLRSFYLKAVREFRVNDEMNIRSFLPKCIVEVKVPLNLRERDVREMFVAYGAISNLLIKLNLFGTSSGWCVIEYRDSASVDRAIAKMDGVMIGEHQLKVQRPMAWEDKVAEQQARQVVVTGVPAIATVETLANHFSRVGHVLHCNIFGTVGFVEYDTFEATQDARERLHNSELLGFPIVVTSPLSETKNLKAPPKNADGSAGNTVRHIRVRNVHPEVDYVELAQYFAKAGQVKYCTINRDLEGKSLGSATVEFYQPESATKAFELFSGSFLRDEKLYLRLKNFNKRNERARRRRDA